MLKLFPLFAAFLFLTACASNVKTEITSYGQAPSIEKNQALALIPSDPTKKESLEFQHYRDDLKEKLRAAGYKIVEPDQKPDLLAEFDYAIMPARTQTTYYRQRPAFGPFGGIAYGYRTGFGYGHRRPYIHRHAYIGYSFPLGGYDDYEERRTSTTTYYDRNVSLIVHRPNENKRLYESKINGTSTCNQTKPVMKVLIEKLASQFPIPAQKNETIELPDDAC